MDQQKNHLEAYFRQYMQGKHAMFFKYTLKVAPYAERQRLRFTLNIQHIEGAEGKACNIKKYQKGLSY